MSKLPEGQELLELLLKSGKVLLHHQGLIPEIMRCDTPSAADTLILGHTEIQNFSLRTRLEIARSAYALRAILRDYPEEIPKLEQLFHINLK